MEWLNEPALCSILDDKITVKTLPRTDFWRVTHYDFIRDNGHFYFDWVDGDFVAEVEVSGNYKDLYDQAGVMLRVDEHNWIKTGIEYVDGLQQLSAVVTRDYSDWSVTPLDEPLEPLYLRVERYSETIRISYKNTESKYVLLRLAYFPNTPKVQMGIMCASPEGEGYKAVFKNYQLKSVV